MLRFTASKLLDRNLNLLKGAFIYITESEGSVYSNSTNQLEKIWGIAMRKNFDLSQARRRSRREKISYICDIPRNGILKMDTQAIL